MTIELKGNWKKGFALDLHTESSTYLGPDEFGHDRFTTKRTEIGELVYRLKYQADISILPKIVSTIISRISNINTVDFIIPVPPSNPSRRFQPVLEVAYALGKSVKVSVIPDAVIKTKKTPELKNVSDLAEREKILSDAFSISSKYNLSSKTVLLIDDLYRSGATLRSITKAICDQGKAKNVFVITLTKTRSTR